MIERRYIANPSKVQLVTRADGGPMIVGYASVFYDPADSGTSYKLWSDTEERILPTAFDRAIKEDDVRALFNHDVNELLGRNTAGTLRLSVDAKGLRYEIDPPKTQRAAEVLEWIGRGDVTASSFGFVPLKTNYREELRDGKPVYIVERTEVQLWDVSPVTYPAYKSTSADVRNLAAEANVRQELEDWKRSRRSARDPIIARAKTVERGW